MSDVRALVLRTVGTNCDGETVHALELAGARTDRLHLAALAREPQRLDDYDVLVIAGGFSYGDYVGAGRVFAAELERALGGGVRAFKDRGGLVLGVCNGFQVLVQTGLLRGDDEDGPRDFALHQNESDRFECRWVTLESQDCACPWIVPGERLPVPVAHAEGRFVVRDRAVLERLAARRQIALRYVAPDGGAAQYPDNPNGSVDGIAGICDPTGRVLGLMPHPERNVTPWHHPLWTRRGAREEGEGLAFYRRLVRTAADVAPASATT